MVKKTALVVLLLSPWVLGATLTVDSGAHLSLVSLTDLNEFVSLVNQTIVFVESQPNVEGAVPPLALLRNGVGLALGEVVGDGIAFGARAALGSWESATEGTWTSEGVEYPVSLSLRVELLAVEGQLRFAVVPGLLSLGMAVGWGMANLDYSCSFALPTDWAIPFQPPPGKTVFRAAGPVGEVSAQVSLPVASGLSFGVEAGFRLADLGVPKAGDTPLDLDGDSEGEKLELTGLWLGICVKLAFAL
jgi:hypothetical protein